MFNYCLKKFRSSNGIFKLYVLLYLRLDYYLYFILKIIFQIEENTDDSVNSLERLDRLKAEMECVKQALHEADNWSILAADFETVENARCDSVLDSPC